MARKTIPAYPSRDRSRDEESLLLRSAESLGRMIGSLQRQLDIATGRLAAAKPNGSGKKKSGAKKSMAAKSGTNGAPGKARKKTGGTQTAARKSAKKR